MVLQGHISKCLVTLNEKHVLINPRILPRMPDLTWRMMLLLLSRSQLCPTLHAPHRRQPMKGGSPPVPVTWHQGWWKKGTQGGSKEQSQGSRTEKKKSVETLVAKKSYRESQTSVTGDAGESCL